MVGRQPELWSDGSRSFGLKTPLPPVAVFACGAFIFGTSAAAGATAALRRYPGQKGWRSRERTGALCACPSGGQVGHAH